MKNEELEYTIQYIVWKYIKEANDQDLSDYGDDRMEAIIDNDIEMCAEEIMKEVYKSYDPFLDPSEYNDSVSW